MLAPVILFVYNRPNHTKITLDALKKNTLAKDSILIIHCDGALLNKDLEYYENIEAVRQICDNIDGFRDIIIIKSDYNKGLVNSIIEGVTETLNKFEKVIVLEDDLITSPYFLEFMNEGLDVYQKHNNVYSINGYCFPLDNINEYISFLIPLIGTWGWGTWKDKWSILDIKISNKEYLINNQYIQKCFNFGKYEYSKMFTSNEKSWGIIWYYSVFLHHGLCLFPSKSLIQNVGFDKKGTNCGDYNPYYTKLSDKKITVLKEYQINLKYYSYVANFLSKDLYNQKYYNRIINKINKILK